MLADGLGCESMLYDALIPSLEEVGAPFERGDSFVPELLTAARAVQGGPDLLRPVAPGARAAPDGERGNYRGFPCGARQVQGFDECGDA